MIKSNFEQELKICLCFFQLFGLQLFSVSGICATWGVEKRRSKNFLVYFLILLVLSVVYYIRKIYDFAVEPKPNSHFFVLVDYIEKFLQTVKHFTILLLAFCYSESQFRILQKFYRIVFHAFAEKLDNKIDYKPFRKSFLIKLSIIAGIEFFIIFLLVAFVWKIECQWIEICNSILKSWVNIFSFMYGFIFMFYVELYNQHLQTIREIIQKIEENGSKLFVTVVEPAKFLTEVRSEYEQLSVLKSVHLSLCEIHEEINNCICKTFLIFLIFITYTLVKVGFQMFEFLGNNEVTDPIFVFQLGNFSFLLIYLIIIMHTAEKPRKEVTYAIRSWKRIEIFRFSSKL